MKRAWGVLALLLPLSACAMNAEQAANASRAFCVISADGAVLATSLTQGTANEVAQAFSAGQPVVCAAETYIGQVLAKKGGGK